MFKGIKNIYHFKGDFNTRGTRFPVDLRGGESNKGYQLF